MEKMKSLADQLREKMAKPELKPAGGQEAASVKKIKDNEAKTNDPPILQALADYDNSDHKTMVHFRFDKQTVDFLNQFKIATGVDATKFVAFSVKHFIKEHPELKTIIKKFIQNSSL
jgi:RNA binding exosome subunit